MTRLAAGAAIHFQGAAFVVLGFDGSGQIQLRGEDGTERVMDPGDLAGDPTFGFEGLDARALSPLQAFWDKLKPEVQASALEHEEHMREVLTGYRLGQPDSRFPSEPRPPYDQTSQQQRIEAKAAELGVTSRQVFRWLRDYRAASHHPAALIDRNTTRVTGRLGRAELPISEAILRVAKRRQDDTDITFVMLRDLVQRELDALGQGDVTLPSQPTFIKLIQRYAPELTHSAKRRRSDASRGKARPFGKIVCVRPGQYVLIDITPFDLTARSEVDGRQIRLRMIVAMDLYSRAIVAARLIEVEPRGVDITTLILDVVHPVRAHPSWPPLPEDARLPYLGIPEGVMLAAHDMPEGEPLLNLPPVLPEAIVVDNGMVFLSRDLRDLCLRLGTDILLARPGTGSDKAHVERLFLHIRQSLAERLEGYVGPHVLARGHQVQARHFPWELQFELTQWVARYYNHRPHDGLCHPRSPKIKLTPMEMFAFGVSHAGHLTVPLGREAYYLALRTELRVITDTGVRIDGAQYDSDVLNPFRGQESPYLELGRRWPFKVDARDPTVIHFQHPQTLAWHEIPERDADWRARPFQAELADQVKVVLQERAGAEDDPLANIRREMDDAYAERVARSLKLATRTAKQALTGRQKQEIARREAAEAQHQAMTGKARAQKGTTRKTQAPPVPSVPEETDDGGRYEVVGDEF
ncbi:integrase catalytic subunit [Deinococcus aerius]|uniref:Integrase catalytic subunit n=1 Tax=Deinococcus aerius TaxID=200253 RepID=A0A2I9D1J5_9DEIO|nr:DDE-type integrase/transposase/recombinase [Deinococcus aerius]GBF03900.1 integrase catalytic subunit [Deinococcus aerius]